MDTKRFVGTAVLVALAACKGSCACGPNDDEDGAGGGGGNDTVAVTTGSTVTGGPSTPASSGTGPSSGGGEGGSGDGGAGPGGGEQGGAGPGGGGVGGSGVGGGQVAAAECETVDDCQLVNDCCTCAGLPISERPEECAVQCVISKCEELQLPAETLSCVAGRCVAGFACDWGITTCDAAPPNCPDGETASVQGGCYGPCVPTGECSSVQGCDQCDGGLACVEKSAFTSTFHCADNPCEAADCACFGASVCDPDQDACSETESGVNCSCTVC